MNVNQALDGIFRPRLQAGLALELLAGMLGVYSAWFALTGSMASGIAMLLGAIGTVLCRERALRP